MGDDSEGPGQQVPSGLIIGPHVAQWALGALRTWCMSSRAAAQGFCAWDGAQPLGHFPLPSSPGWMAVSALGTVPHGGPLAPHWGTERLPFVTSVI